MLNKEKHQLIMGQILKDIYTDISISPLLGFKGGTCAYFFYGLPRFSVDLDFDMFETSEENQKTVLEKLVAILGKYGQIKDQYIKRFTIFALVSYGDDDHNIKVEINIRKLAKEMKGLYELKEYLGIPMLAAKKDYLFAGKLAALTLRTETAMRDIFDINYFAKNHWDINAEVIKNLVDKTVKEYLSDCIVFIEKTKDGQMLQGMGELMENEKQKDWVRQHLKTDVLFMLKNYSAVMK
jgi:predicted nucleotidyltransferase component of viral defense system